MNIVEKINNLNIKVINHPVFKENITEEQKEIITELYLQMEFLKKFYYYYQDKKEIKKLLTIIESYIDKIGKLLEEIDNIKIEQLSEIKDRINAIFQELQTYVNTYHIEDRYKIFSFNYFLWFFFNYSLLNLSVRSDIVLNYLPKEQYIRDYDNFKVQYAPLFELIIQNSIFHFDSLSSDKFLYFLENPNILSFFTPDSEITDLTTDEIELYYDILVDFDVTYFLCSEKNIYYIFRKGDIYIVNFNKEVIERQEFIVDFDNVFDFFRDNVFFLDEEIRQHLKSLFIKLHFQNGIIS